MPDAFSDGLPPTLMLGVAAVSRGSRNVVLATVIGNPNCPKDIAQSLEPITIQGNPVEHVNLARSYFEEM